ncbi:MAG: RsmD family RNA methyltransferase [Deltaproteobacteria bacterium]|nr:RsmD family RNA methyltransferase [Deltaproteobacteria bacterium]
MRIVAGTRKGLALRVPEGRAVRPTPGRVREAAMSVLGGFLDGERVLDVCAGSGAMALELLSRGAGEAVLVEPDAEALLALRHNLQRARFEGQVRLLAMAAEQALPQLGREGRPFDLIWLDPPWDGELHLPLVALLARHGLLAAGGELWIEHDGRLQEAAIAQASGGRFALEQRRRYGSVCVDRWMPVAEAGE